MVRASRSNLTGSYHVPARLTGAEMPVPIIASGTQCPFTGFIDGACTIGCMLYPDAHDRGGTMDCALSYRGKVFTCPARDTLTTTEIHFAARITGDWFYYGLLIHHPSLLRHIMADGCPPDAHNNIFLTDMRNKLDELRINNPALHKIDSYFGDMRNKLDELRINNPALHRIDSYFGVQTDTDSMKQYNP
jgi:hypothetical protein